MLIKFLYLTIIFGLCSCTSIWYRSCQDEEPEIRCQSGKCERKCVRPHNNYFRDREPIYREHSGGDWP